MGERSGPTYGFVYHGNSSIARPPLFFFPVAAVSRWGPRRGNAQVWESLVLERGVKTHLLEYATSALLFTDKGVSKNIISWNRCVGALSVAVNQVGSVFKSRRFFFQISRFLEAEKHRPAGCGAPEQDSNLEVIPLL